MPGHALWALAVSGAAVFTGLFRNRTFAAATGATFLMYLGFFGPCS